MLALLASMIPLVASIAPKVALALGAGRGSIVFRAVNAISVALGGKSQSIWSETEVEKLKIQLEQTKNQGIDKLKDLDSVFEAMTENQNAQTETERQKVLAISAQTSLEDTRSESFFRYGWRVTVAWICVASFLITNFLLPIATIVFVFVAPSIAEHLQRALPEAIISTNLALLGYLLGYGAMRTVEKLKGIHEFIPFAPKKEKDVKLGQVYQDR